MERGGGGGGISSFDTKLLSKLSPGFPTSSLMSSFHNFTQVQLSTESAGQAFAKQGDGQESTVGWVTVVGGVGNQPMGGKAH